MRKHRIALFGVLLISSLPLSTYADVTVVNNTDYYGTASLSLTPCSSRAGDRGIIPPHGSLTVPGSLLNTFCSLFSCDAHIYASKDCSGKEVATVTVDSENGITSIKNYAKDQFVINGGGMSATIDPASGSWKNWLKWFFG